MIYKLENKIPIIGKNNFIAENATIIGAIETKENVSIWYSTVLRADCCTIKIGKNTNIQDNSTVHGDKAFPVIVGENVTIGHNCVIHGCTIENNVVIGMGSVLLNGSKILKNCIVAAGSVVSSKLEPREGVLIAGNPAKIIKELSVENKEYIEYAKEMYLYDIEIYKKIEIVD
ncbi:MAG: gamma carbonic anhydrase family protein [Fusobacteriaceae bacterium]